MDIVQSSEIARFSKNDSEAIDEFGRRISDVALILREIVKITPPNIGGGWQDILQALKVATNYEGSNQHNRQRLLN